MPVPLGACLALWLAWLAFWTAAAAGTSRTRSAESMAGRLQHLAPSGLAFWLILIPSSGVPALEWRPFRLPPWLGPTLTALGLGFSIWARLHLGPHWSGMVALKEGHRLIQSGPYRFLRHPIYAGFLLALLATASASGALRAFLGFAAAAAAYALKLAREEALLLGSFPEYAAYRERTGALWPRLGLWTLANRTKDLLFFRGRGAKKP